MREVQVCDRRAPASAAATVEMVVPYVWGAIEHAVHRPAKHALAFAVYDAHPVDAFTAARPQVFLHQVGHLPGPKVMQIQDTVDRIFDGFHRRVSPSR